MISVIVPVYNGEKTIERCVRSILAQKDTQLELLLIDDGSVDNTFALCQMMAREDNRIRLFRQKNTGVSAARNRGLENAGGSFVTFVDADDLLPPGALTALAGGAGSGADFVIGSHCLFRGPWKRIVSHRDSDDISSLMSLMCGKLYRRSLLEEAGLRFRVDLHYGEDTVFNLRYAALAGKIQVLPQVVYLCRMGGVASSRRYYPDRDRIALILLKAYREFGVDTDLIAAKEWEETVLHYYLHCRISEAKKRTARARENLAPFLHEAPNAGRILSRRWLRLLLRRWKKWSGSGLGENWHRDTV